MALSGLHPTHDPQNSKLLKLQRMIMSQALRCLARHSRVLGFFKKLSTCLVGIEACASSHEWSRGLQALGHTVRLMPPAYVKPYLKHQKNDSADAEAICEAAQRPSMRFVPTKAHDQQACLMLHRTRHLFIRQQTALINAIRADLAEFGIVAPVGRNGINELLDVVAEPDDGRLPMIARECLEALGGHLQSLNAPILMFDRCINAWQRSNETSRRLDDLPGGRALATAWLPASPIRRRFDQDATSRPGSGLYRNRIRAEAGSGSAISPSREIDTSARCSAPVHWP